jgi:ATP phosphoribosyltransferase
MIVAALAKGRLLPDITALLTEVGLPTPPDLEDPGDRRLIVDAANHLARVRYLLVKPADVPTYVRHGAADLGITGKDVLLEEGWPLDWATALGIGTCQLSVCGRPCRDWTELLAARSDRYRVATRYPSVTRAYFARLGYRPRLIRLSGSVELAPLVGLADAIVDLVATGRTLRDNGLVEYARITDIFACLIVNPRAATCGRTLFSSVVDRLVAASALQTEGLTGPAGRRRPQDA